MQGRRRIRLIPNGRKHHLPYLAGTDPIHQLEFVFVQAKKDVTLNLFAQGGNQTGFDMKVLYHYKQ